MEQNPRELRNAPIFADWQTLTSGVIVAGKLSGRKRKQCPEFLATVAHATRRSIKKDFLCAFIDQEREKYRVAAFFRLLAARARYIKDRGYSSEKWGAVEKAK